MPRVSKAQCMTGVLDYDAAPAGGAANRGGHNRPSESSASRNGKSAPWIGGL